MQMGNPAALPFSEPMGSDEAQTPQAHKQRLTKPLPILMSRRAEPDGQRYRITDTEKLSLIDGIEELAIPADRGDAPTLALGALWGRRR
jgi:hypothetical protein